MATTFKFDTGPTPSWAKRFFDAPRNFYVTHPAGRFRTEFGPVYYRGVAVEPTILDYRNGLFDKVLAENTLQAIITFGNGADLAISNWPGRPGAVPWFQLHHPSAPDDVVLPNWNANLNAMQAAVTPDSASLVDLTPYGATFGPNDVTDIPREDLSFGIPDWHGTGGGTRSQRDGDKTIRWTSPL